MGKKRVEKWVRENRKEAKLKSELQNKVSKCGMAFGLI
jgi:hypothetical protein